MVKKRSQNANQNMSGKSKKKNQTARKGELRAKFRLKLKHLQDIDAFKITKNRVCNSMKTDKGGVSKNAQS